MAKGGDVSMLVAVQQDWERRMGQLSNAILAADGENTLCAPKTLQFQTRYFGQRSKSQVTETVGCEDTSASADEIRMGDINVYFSLCASLWA